MNVQSLYDTLVEKYGTNRPIQMDVAAIAKMFGMSRSSGYVLSRTLQDAGLMTVERRFKKKADGNFGGSEVYITLRPNKEKAPMPTKTIGAPRKLNWDQLLADFINVLPLGVEQKTNAAEIAKMIGTQSNASTQISVILRALGALELRYEAGRSYYKRTADEPEIRQHLADKGWTIGSSASYAQARALIPNIGITGTPGGRKPRGQRATADTQPMTHVEYAEAIHEQPIKRDLSDMPAESPFAALRPLKRDEAAALVEAARQYSKRSSFLDEEITRFADMGITLTREMIELPRDERLEHVGLVLDYIDRLAAENERLHKVTESTRGPIAEMQALRDQVRKQHEQIERMVREKAQAAELMANERAEYRQRLQALNRERDNALETIQNMARVARNGGEVVADPTRAAR